MFAPIIFYLIIYSRCQGASEDFCTCVLVPRNRNPVRIALAYELKVYMGTSVTHAYIVHKSKDKFNRYTVYSIQY